VENKDQSSSSPLSEIISDGCFVEALAFVEELSNVIAGVLQQVVLNQELDPLRKREGPQVTSCSSEHVDQITFLKNPDSFFNLPFWGPC